MKCRSYFVAILMAIMFSSIYVFPVVSGNGICKPFDDCYAPQNGIGPHSISIEYFVNQGTAYYLKSHGDFQYALYFLEKENMDNGIYQEQLKSKIESAIENLANSNIYYSVLYYTVLDMKYDENVVERLKCFDYQGFQTEKNLNPSIFCTAVEYLKNAKMKEFCRSLDDETKGILTTLEKLKLKLENGIIDINLFWQVNQKYLETLLLGQIVSMVLKEI